VEDDSWMREELIDVLQKEGFEAVAMTDFHDIALQIATSAPPSYEMNGSLIDRSLPTQFINFMIC
jgi:DNA-binding response OmpR family regulator